MRIQKKDDSSFQVKLLTELPSALAIIRVTPEGWPEIFGVNFTLGPSATATSAGRVSPRPSRVTGPDDMWRGIVGDEVGYCAVPWLVAHHCVRNLVVGLYLWVLLADVLGDDLHWRPVMCRCPEKPYFAVE